MSIRKRAAVVLALALSMIAAVLPAPIASASVSPTNLLANGSFELTREYDFPVGGSSNGENLIPNGDFESRAYWRYNNGNLSYEYDEELGSTVGKLEWNGGAKGWNAVTMRSDGGNNVGIYWDYAQNKRITVSSPTFTAIPIKLVFTISAFLFT